MPESAPKLTEKDVSVTKLRDEHASLIANFECEGLDEENFLKKDALAHQSLGLSETFLLIENNGGKLISYITLSFGSFKLSENEPIGGIPIRDKQTHIYQPIPCLLIGKLATDKREGKRGGGSLMLLFAAQKGIEINGILTLPFMALHSHPDKVGYYKERGFGVAFTPVKKDADTLTMYRSLPKKD